MENNKDPTALISVNKQKLDIQCHTQTYFHTNESVWLPKKWAQIFKNFTNFFFTLISLITVHSSYLINL